MVCGMVREKDQTQPPVQAETKRRGLRIASIISLCEFQIVVNVCLPMLFCLPSLGLRVDTHIIFCIASHDGVMACLPGVLCVLSLTPSSWVSQTISGIILRSSG